MEAWIVEFAAQLAKQLDAKPVTDKDALHRVKSRLARQLATPRMPRDSELAAAFAPEASERWSALLRTKPMRTESGVAIVAVMSSPAGCPHGKCIYCPGGPEVDAPQSYTGFEPSTMRARRFDYDPYRITRSRLGQLARNGHSTDKVEIIVQGGTFPAREPAYQDWFIGAIFAACNDGPADESVAPWEALDAWITSPLEARHERVARLQKDNEQAPCRIIGLTIETKPDWCFEEHVDDMLRLGATRIELGVQTLDEATTKLTNRGHTVQDAADAMRIARDAGLKLCIHLMPGLPRPQDDGSVCTDDAMDLEDMRRVFSEPEWQPDMLKIYPTLVVEDGETTLKKWWKQGKYTPLDTAHASTLISQGLASVPEWCRIQRIDRDIPTTHVVAGVQNSNLRQIAESEAATHGVHSRDIRAREVATRVREGIHPRHDALEIVHREFACAGGLEVFLSHEDVERDVLVSFLRLRRVGPSPHRPEFQHERGTAVVRELKVYGVAQELGTHESDAWQHTGLGGQLLARAESLAAEWGVGRMLVIAGAGVKEYYRKHGYSDLGPYVAKELP